MTRPPATRLAGAVLGALVVIGLAATPAAADPPRPTDFRSTVTEVRPALPAGAEVRVVGGDALLELTIPAGHTAVVADYPTSGGDPASAVPYLRFDADGTVRRNASAVATAANGSRYGTTRRAPDPGAGPRWETVATDGSYAWHDHRIHWMSPTRPRAVDDDGQVDLGGPDGTWTVPITVDGTPTTVTGTLVLVDPPSVAAWGLVASGALVVALAVGLRWGQRAGAAVGAVVAAGAVITAWATWQAVPADAGAPVAPVAVAAIALAAGLTGAVGPDRTRLVAVAATAAALLGWGATRWAVLTRAVLPTTLAPSLDRGVTSASIGVGLGLAVLLLARPARRTTSPQAAPGADRPVTATPTA
ncbi:MAG: hypothetical protein JWO77_1262 [Ilumatobacteraceae bacterium]|nr:hypothetical protein [Ilumatobacteraceae bacterium]